MRSHTLFTIGLVSLLTIGQVGSARAESKEAASARAEIQQSLGFVPEFFKEIPENALPGAWRELSGLELSTHTALSCKIKELIGLAVASQIPCRYCTYSHTKFAAANGASRAEIGEAIAMSAQTRHWSTIFNGVRLDESRYEADIARLLAAAKSPPKPAAQPMTPIRIVDAQSALANIKQSFGFVPEFFYKTSSAALPGAWIELRDVELNPHTALPSKYKSLVGLAVASQIPCRYCVIGDTQISKFAGASDEEINEAIAMAAIVRHWSSYLNGLMSDETTFRRDVDRLVNSKTRGGVAVAGKGTR